MLLWGDRTLVSARAFVNLGGDIVGANTRWPRSGMRDFMHCREVQLSTGELSPRLAAARGLALLARQNFIRESPSGIVVGRFSDF